MRSLSSLAGWIQRFPLPLFLIAQGALLFFRLDLLPVWGDEQFTMDVVRRPWGEIPAILRADIHPPLYYFLARAWSQLPWSGSLIEQLRALSAVVALASTALVYQLWLRDLPARMKLWFLALWSLSPTLLLYSRMARSYSLQLLLGCLAVYLAFSFLKKPGDRRAAVAYAAGAGLLLYTHYLPGIAVIAAATLLFIAKRWREPESTPFREMLLANGLVALIYVPWLTTLGFALSRVSRAEPYFLVENFALETLVKLAYWFTSFTFGESFPVWAMLLGAVLGPAVVWLLWEGLKVRPAWLPLALLTAVIAYLGATAWVTFPFVGARLLFLLPFYLLWILHGKEKAPKWGTVACGGMLVVSLGAVTSYYQKQGFLNQGYLVPFGEIAQYIENRSAESKALLLVEGYNTDPSPLLARLQDKLPCIKIRGEESRRLARDRINGGGFETVWYLRNTHDISPGGVITELEAELMRHYEGRRHYYVPYSPADRFASSLLGWEHQATHHYQMLETRKRRNGDRSQAASRSKSAPTTQIQSNQEGVPPR